MKTLITARNIINADEVEDWLRDQFATRYEPLMQWLLGPVRKWIIKSAPAEVAPIQDKTGMPDWLRQSLDRGEKPERVVLGDALQNQLSLTLDYMLDLVAVKPDTNLMAIGYDVAQKRAEKWHADMAKRAKNAQVVQEDGANIIKTYGDGYTWRTVVGKEAMEREGDVMGHCVGRFSYYQMVIRAKCEIVSLRDNQNEPHVTIEIGEHGKTIHQIKGKANKDVLPKYLPYVLDFLKTRTWTHLNFDGATALRDEYSKWLMNESEPYFTHDGFRFVADVSAVSWGTRSLTGALAVMKDGEQVASLVASSVPGVERPLLTRMTGDSPRLIEAVRRAMVHMNIGLAVTNQEFVQLLIKNTSWSGASGWVTPKTEGAKHMLTVLGRGLEMLYLDKDGEVQAAYSGDNKLLIMHTLLKQEQQALALELGKPASVFTVVNAFDGTATAKSDLTSWLAKNAAGKKVDASDDVSLLNSLMTALSQPDAAGIKAAYMALKSKSSVRDSDFKQYGFPTGGRAINAIGLVLVSTLPLKNLAPFRQYIFEKPHAMTCWSEVLEKPDHLLASLRSYGLTDDLIKQITGLLRNEFLRLLPKESEIEGLDLSSATEHKLLQLIKRTAAMRQDAARSKRLWGSL